jgi:hypothetical protein
MDAEEACGICSGFFSVPYIFCASVAANAIRLGARPAKFVDPKSAPISPDMRGRLHGTGRINSNKPGAGIPPN